MVTFSRSLYTFAESFGVARPELIFSNPSANDITIIVGGSNNNAIG